VNHTTPSLALSQLTGPSARAFIWAYYVTMAVLALWTIGDVRSPLPTLIGLGLFAAVCLALSVDRAETLALSTTAFVCAVGVCNALLISWQLEAGGHSQWYFGAGTVALFFVSLRGHRLLAWVGFIPLAAVIAVWGATTDTGLVDALALIGRQVPVLLTGTLLATSLSRSGKAIARLTAEASRRSATAAAAEATAVERNARLAVLDSVATPLLARIVDGAPLTSEDRQEFALAEAALRDGLRARSLSVPAVIDAVRDARRRGVGVVLLDDSSPGSVTAEDLERVVQAIVAAVRAARDGRVTARLLPPGREVVATIVVDGSEYAAHEVPRLSQGAG
jgi:hypothetical protein